jgi:hypothetical protein
MNILIRSIMLISISTLGMSSQVHASNRLGQLESYSFDLNVGFRSGQLELSSEARDQLYYQVHSYIEDYRVQLASHGVDLNNGQLSIREVIIYSRSDARGDAYGNMTLSERRAQFLVPELENMFMREYISFDESKFTAIGLGESEADENACKYTQQICRLEKMELKTSPSAEPEKSWFTATVEFFSGLLVPTANARGLGILDIIIDPILDPLLELSPIQIDPYQRPYNLPPPVVIEPNRNYFPPAPATPNYNYPPSQQQCVQVSWDEACLDSQRYASIQIVLEFNENSVVKEDISPSVTVITLPPLEKPASQEEVAPAQNQPEKKIEVTPLPPVDSAATKEDVAPPAKPAPPKIVPQLKVYGNPIN